METSITLIDFINAIKKRWKSIAAITVAAVLISVCVSYFVLTPVYQTSTQILVNQKNTANELDLSLMQRNVDLISTYSMIIKSPAILDKVIEDLELTQTVEQLNKQISIESQENSQVFYLIVEDINHAKAVNIANSISETFQKDIKEIMSVDNVSILARAELKENPIPIKPNHMLNIAIALVVGVLIGTGLAIVLETLDKTLKDGYDVETYLGLPVIGSIESISGKKFKKVKRANSITKLGGETLES